MLKFISFLPLGLLLLGCTSGKDVSHISETNPGLRDTTGGQKERILITDPKTDSAGVTRLTGKAYNQKGGAVLVTSTEETYWIDGLASWDDVYVNKPVRVWGTIIVRNDNPVFLDTGKTVSQGIPVETEAELDAQQNRSWILNASYELIRP